MRRQGPPRVLQVLTCDGVGGTEFMVATLVERAEPAAVDMDVVTLDARGPIAERLARAGVRVRCLGGSGLALAFARLARILARERYDVVNAYGFKSTAVARGLTKLLSPGTAFVSGVRGLHVSELEHLDGPKSRVVLRLERLGSPLVDVYDANSKGALELLAAQGVPRAKLHYIPNGIDADAWTREADRPAAVPTVLCIARFVARKRHGDLVRAAAELHRGGVAFRLVLAGDGPLLEPTRALVAELGLEGQVDLPGRAERDAVRRLLAEADVFCLPSLWEGMAGSVMEAMAASLPVVGTDVNGIADLVVDGVTGRLVAPESPAAIAAALAELLVSSELRERFGQAGRRRIIEEFSVEEMVRAKQDLYRLVARAGVA